MLNICDKETIERFRCTNAKLARLSVGPSVRHMHTQMLQFAHCQTTATKQPCTFNASAYRMSPLITLLYDP